MRVRCEVGGEVKRARALTGILPDASSGLVVIGFDFVKWVEDIIVEI